MMERRDLSAEDAEEAEVDDEPRRQQKKKKKSGKNKRRFSDEQVRSLEMMFESETKIDPRNKVQVAAELGLQPRQVAIWFQNKRARWKTKEIEKNYTALRANYESLKARFLITEKEKESLHAQLQELHNQLQKTQEGRSDGKKEEEEKTRGVSYLRQEEHQWRSFNSASLFHEPSSGSHWWDSET
ncbi:hypothetical protein Nepgr_031435 [Nepenthes gracilis]|uniref:Homeobox-leucine zipper protein n=1 Tax=Nepenthes gracilis TaxID=150966 RepID=A0AAD3Y4T1_NEPGR|nr:hypothetical protein Nepgr_031435 [Nepenthes gracilis]